MKLLKRNMICNNETNTANDNLNEYLPQCQASFNSDGCITVRNYDKSNPSKDEIIILSYEETRAILTLFSRIGEANKNYNLPF